MIEAVAQAAGRAVSRETFERLELFAALLDQGAREQNLVAASTLPHLWERHILDAAQLVRFEPSSSASWVDIGSGAGIPGLVIAILVEGPVTLVEPRRLRSEFLTRAVDRLGLANRVRVEQAKVERVSGRYDVITARAVAALPRLLEISAHLSTRNSIWVLPKGRSGESELAEARRTWQGVFHVERSITDDDSTIIVASGVRAR